MSERWRLPIICVLVSLLVGAPGALAAKADERMTYAQAAMRANSYRAPAAAYRKAARDPADEAEALLGLAHVYRGLEQLEKAAGAARDSAAAASSPVKKARALKVR